MKFRNVSCSRDKQGKRNGIEYTAHFREGKKAEEQWAVWMHNPNTLENFQTDAHSIYFASLDQVSTYCEDLHAGKIDWRAMNEALRQRRAERDAVENARAKEAADKFKAMLKTKNLSIHQFLYLRDEYDALPWGATEFLYK